MLETARLRDFLNKILSRLPVLGRYFMPKTVNEKIWYAILGKRLLAFDCRGCHRVVEPHVYGDMSGRIQMMTYQLRGQSSSGKLPNWRRMNLEDITNVRVLRQEFQGRRPVKGRHSVWDKIHLIVAE
jgi:hypothetical protein